MSDSSRAMGEALNEFVLRRSKAKGRRRTAALAGSLAAHVFLVVSLFIGAKGVIAGGEGGAPNSGETPAFTISLEGLQGGSVKPRKAATPSDPLTALYQQVRADQADMTLPLPPIPDAARPDRMSELFDALADQTGNNGREDARGAQDAGGRAQASAGARRTTNANLDELMGNAAASGPGADTGQSSGLWKQIEPCWNRLPDRSEVPVTLELTLNERGMIAVPPRIIRPSGSAPDSKRLLSEARALAALSGCTPYIGGGVPEADRQVVVQFAVSRR